MTKEIWVEKRQMIYSNKNINSKQTIELKIVSLPNHQTSTYDEIQIKIVMSNTTDKINNKLCILLNLTQTMTLYYNILFKPKDILEGKTGEITYQHITDTSLKFIYNNKEKVIIDAITGSSETKISIEVPIQTYRTIHFIISEFIKNFIMLNNLFITQDKVKK